MSWLLMYETGSLAAAVDFASTCARKRMRRDAQARITDQQPRIVRSSTAMVMASTTIRSLK